jgi:hypothetical protein
MSMQGVASIPPQLAAIRSRTLPSKLEKRSSMRGVPPPTELTATVSSGAAKNRGLRRHLEDAEIKRQSHAYPGHLPRESPTDDLHAKTAYRGLRRSAEDWEAKRRAAAPMLSREQRQYSSDLYTSQTSFPEDGIFYSKTSLYASQKTIRDEEEIAMETESQERFNDEPERRLSGRVDASGLVRARPVDDASMYSGIMRAEEVDERDLELQEIRRQRNMQRKGIFFSMGVIACLCVVLGIVVIGTAVGLFLRRDEESQPTTTPISVPVFTQTPKSGPTVSPSPGTTDAKDAMDLSDLPAATVERIKTFNTPQWLAYDWLVRHPSLATLQEWRKKQLFALATFFYSMQGTEWPDLKRKSWLDTGESECFCKLRQGGCHMPLILFAGYS